MTRVVDQQVIFPSLRLKLGKVKSDFLVHWNLYLPRAVFVVFVISRIVCGRHRTTWPIQECSAARVYKNSWVFSVRVLRTRDSPTRYSDRGAFACADVQNLTKFKIAKFN